jgi:anti-sigma B factor antagonist
VRSIGPESTGPARQDPNPRSPFPLAQEPMCVKEGDVASPFGARIESRNGVARIALTGELDMSTVPELERHLGACEAGGTTAIVDDLQDLGFVDSSGLHAFVRARTDAQTNGHRLHLVGASRAAQRVFELTGTEFLIEEPAPI